MKPGSSKGPLKKLFTDVIKTLMLEILATFNPIQDRGKKAPLASCSTVTSTNVEISPQNFLTFSFNPFATLMQNFKAIPSASPKLLTKITPQKNWLFWNS